MNISEETNSVTITLSGPAPSPKYGYGSIAPHYLERNFKPIPLHGKICAVEGATGTRGSVTDKKVDEWRHQYPAANIGLVADGWISIDVDHHDEKFGADQLVELEKELGPLPKTFSSTSRGQHSPCRQYFFRVKENYLLISKLAKDIDVIHHKHRYSVVSPSIHPKTLEEYAWYTPDGEPIDELPTPADFSELPDAWIDHMRKRSAIASASEKETYSGDLLEWESLLNDSPPTPHALALLEEIESQTHIGHDELLNYLINIHEYRFGIWERGLLHVLDALRKKYFDTTHEPRPKLEWENAVRWAISSSWDPKMTVPEKTGQETLERLQRETLEQSELKTFWEKRPALRAIYTLARQTTIAPWALLGAAIQRALHTVPYDVHYQSYRGLAPLNTLVAFVGRTGAGKTQTQNILNDWIIFPDNNPHSGRIMTWGGPTNPGSGEAMPDSYLTNAKDDEGKSTKVWAHPNHAAIFAFDESGMLEARNSRDGSTFLEYMKEGWSGETFGRKLKNGTGVELPKRSYRFALYVNVQPAKAQLYFSESSVAGGLPSRILFMNLEDKDAALHDDRSEPTMFTIPAINWSDVKSIKTLPHIDEEHRKEALRRVTGDYDDMDSHRLLNKAKVSVALAVLDGRPFLIEEDWKLAEVVTKHSGDTRAHVLKELERVITETIQKQGKAAGIKASIASEVEANRMTRRVAEKIKKWKDSGKPPRYQTNPYRDELRSVERDFYDEAISLLERQSDSDDEL